MAQPQVLSSKQINSVKNKAPTRGYNDFNLITRQYENLNSNKGYPYGSPPSPTHHALNNIDFQFSDVTNDHRYQCPVAPATNHYFTTVSTNRNNSDHEDDDDDYDELVYHHNQVNMVQSGPTLPRRRLIDASSCGNNLSIPPVPPQRILPIQTPPPPPRGDTPENDGPFVFGVHHPNTFTPAYDKAKDVGSSVQQNNFSDISSSRNTSSSEKERRALVKAKKRTKKDKKQKSKDKSKEKQLASSSSSSSNSSSSTKEKFGDAIQDEDDGPNVKCVLVGDGAVGKTNLIVSYIQDRFIPEYVPTAFDKYNVDVSVDGRPICVTLCDTAGQDALDPLRQLCYPGTDVFLLCFSVVQPESFRSLATKWAPEVSKLRGAVVLVGTQSDLRNDRSTALKLQIQGEKPVPVSAAWDFARKIGAKYIETSSHKKERIKETFDTAIWDVLQAREFNRKRPLWKRMLCLTC